MNKRNAVGDFRVTGQCRRGAVRVVIDYHIGIDERQDWAYAGEPLVPLKGFPAVVWERPGRKQRLHKPAMF